MRAKTGHGDFSQGSIPRNILRLAIPIMLAEFVHVLYNMIDRVYIGHISDIGTTALTGVGIVLPLITIATAFASLCGTGGAPLCSIARGEGDDERARTIMETSLTLLLLFGVVLTAVFVLIKEQALIAMGADDETLSYSLNYFSIYLTGTVFTLISLGMNPFINAQGFSKIGMCTVLIGAVLNIILDPIFIFALGLGVQGAALATVISQFFSALWVLAFLLGPRIPLRVQRLRLEWKTAVQILRLGVTGFSIKITNSATQTVANATLRAWGGSSYAFYIGAMSIINPLREVASQPVSGITGGAQPVIGYNYGMKLYSRVSKSIWFMLLSTLAYNLTAWAILMLAPSLLVRLFTPDPALANVTVPCLRIYFGAFFMMSFQMTGQNTYIALNKPRLAVFYSLFRKVILVIPLTLMLPHTSLGVMGVFYAEMISQVVGSSSCFLTMVFAVWRKLGELERQPKNRT